MKKVIIILVSVLVVALAIFIGYKVLVHNYNQQINDLQEALQDSNNQVETLQIQNDELQNPPHIQMTVSTLKEYTAPASELITYKYYYTDTGEYEKNQTWGGIDLPFTKDKSIYVYSGVISAGIDVSDIKYVVDEGNMKIIVAMPEPKIIAHEMDADAFKSYDVSKSIFTESSLDNYADFQSNLQKTQEDKLNSNKEFWDSVKSNAENVIKDILTMHDDVSDYQLEFSWVGK